MASMYNSGSGGSGSGGGKGSGSGSSGVEKVPLGTQIVFKIMEMVVANGNGTFSVDQTRQLIALVTQAHGQMPLEQLTQFLVDSVANVCRHAPLQKAFLERLGPQITEATTGVALPKDLAGFLMTVVDDIIPKRVATLGQAIAAAAAADNAMGGPKTKHTF